MAQEVKTVLFRNFSDQVFSSVELHEVNIRGTKLMVTDETCRWDGEDYTFKPGESRYMPDWKAAHFAKHLVNRELIKMGLDNDTSPKRPKDNPRFMALWKKAYIEDPKSVSMSETKAEDELIELNKDLEIEKLKAENEALKSGAKDLPEAPEVGKMAPHTITEEDIENNPGIENDVQVGDEVLLPSVEDEDAPSDEGFADLPEEEEAPKA